MSEISAVSPLPSDIGRLGRLRTNIKPDTKIMEIGGSYNPVAPRSAGYNTFTVDHASQDELIEKYKALFEDPQIEPVDFICHDGVLSGSVGEEHHHTFDLCIASHVIEHMTNPVTFLQNAEKMLTPNGIFTMAVPDKRGCFDFFRALTGTGDWLAAYERKASLHTGLARFDFEAYTVGHNGIIQWAPGDLRQFSFASKGLYEAYRIMKEVGDATTGEYYDIHAWTFVPSSFALIIYELHALGLTKFVPQNIHTSGMIEFMVDLVKVDQAPITDEGRMTLLKRAALEQAEGFNQISG